MNDQTSIAVTFIAFLLLFVMVGTLAALRKQNTTTDYLLASRNVNPWLTELSAMATTQSGFLFAGVVGFSYKLGLASIWFIVSGTYWEPSSLSSTVSLGVSAPSSGPMRPRVS